jgi:PAS domain S-box-containing protein/putative nucleotidyltransferase with HDIG domain
LKKKEKEKKLYNELADKTKRIDELEVMIDQYEIKLEKAKRSVRRFQILVNNAKDILYSTNNKGIITFISSNVSVFGIKANDMINTKITDYIMEPDREKVDEIYKSDHNDKNELTIIVKIMDRKKNIYWMEDHERILKDDSGNFLGIIGIIREVSKRKNIEIELEDVRAGLQKKVDRKVLEFKKVVDQLRKEIIERMKVEEQLQYNLKIQQKTFEEVVNALASAVEKRDPYTYGHQQNVTILTEAIAREMGFDEDQIEGIRIASLLHDIGKIIIPGEILSRPGNLTANEFNLIKEHPRTGYEILKGIEFPWNVVEIILQHHERLDGSGYPDGLKEDEICIEAKILAVADVVEAMITHRPYRPACGREEAYKEILDNKGILYDPEVVDVCIDILKRNNFQFTEE